MVLRHVLDFEKPVEDIERQIEELKGYSGDRTEAALETARLEEQAQKLLREIYSKLTPRQITQVARHPMRPYALDHIESVFDEFIELHGDRAFRDDPAVVGGLASLGGTKVVVIGQQKGRNTKEKLFRNFGMPNPEGYRKALRLMHLAERFSKPVITFIDTPGAYPGIGAEERGQSEAIATNLMHMSSLKVPIISVIIGEGGSGGALAIGVADRVMIFEFSTYSVISPEGCAAILWKDGAKADVAAKALKIDSRSLKELGVVDEIINEPTGGAHRDPEAASSALKKALLKQLRALEGIPAERLLVERYNKYRNIGVFSDPDKK